MEVAALEAAMAELGWRDPVDLVAWSYGAHITLAFALDNPERVRTLTLIEPPSAWVLPNGGVDDADVREMQSVLMGDDVSEEDLAKFLRFAGLVPPEMRPQELPQWPVWVEHRQSLRGGVDPFGYRDDPARLREFDRPVWLVTGTGTAPRERRIHDRLAALLPAARTSEMPAGHAPQIVSMDRFLAELARFHNGVGR